MFERPFLSPNDWLTFSQLNSLRPTLVIGATDVTTSTQRYGLPGRCFQFTLEHFQGAGKSKVAFAIITFVADAANPPHGGDEYVPDARSGLLDYLPLGKAIDAVDTIIDDQRALRAAEFVETRAKLTAALGGDPRCCRVIVLSVHDYLKPHASWLLL